MKPKKKYERESPKSLSRIQAEERVRKVAEMYMELKSTKTVMEWLKNTYKIKESTAWQVIVRANQYIREYYNKDPQVVVSSHINKYYEIYENFKEVDARAAIQALQAVEKILKIYSDQPVVNNNTLQLSVGNLTLDELKTAIKDLKSKQINTIDTQELTNNFLNDAEQSCEENRPSLEG